MKNQKGITLIALVITIIVLLILAGVSIAMLTGENGILTQANSSKSETNKAEATEKISLALNAVKAKVYEMQVGSATYDPYGDATSGDDDDDNLKPSITQILKLDLGTDSLATDNLAGKLADDGKFVYSVDTTNKKLIITYFNTTTNVGALNEAGTAAGKYIKGDINLDIEDDDYLEISTIALYTVPTNP